MRWGGPAPLAKYMLSLDTVKKIIFPLISRIGINYRHGSPSRHAGDENFKVKAGDRMPYFLVDSESIYNKLHQPKFHWLVFSGAEGDPPALKTEIESGRAGSVDFNAVPLYPQVVEAFGADESFDVLLRPDNYIGAISTGTSPSEAEAYLNEFVGRSESGARKIKRRLPACGRRVGCRGEGAVRRQLNLRVR